VGLRRCLWLKARQSLGTVLPVAGLYALGSDLDVVVVDLGPARFRATGAILPEGDLDQLRAADAIFAGAPPAGPVAAPRGTLEHGIIFRIRRELDLYVNLRPFTGRGADVAVVRENTEGAYIGEGGVLRAGTPQAVATQGSITTAFGVERCARYAFALAGSRRGKVTLVHKVNVLTYAGEVWTDTVDRVRLEHPAVECDYADVDAACVQLIEDPSRFDVILTDNLFGDVISDVAGTACGALARSGSADLNPDAALTSLFEPLHAAAAQLTSVPPDQVDPRGAYAAAALLLRHRGETATARTLEEALRAPDVLRPSTAATERAVLAEYGRLQGGAADVAPTP
ncbi:MAG: hypothetical protein J0H43_12180, partial [Actinobacteria bacterium]|nr:hypothetical protein [Actinomycetota bacterium]